MSEENTVYAKLYPDGRLVEVLPDGTERPFETDDTDWERLAAMTEEEVEVNALSDPDFPPLTEEERKRTPPLADAFRIRAQLGMTQMEFAETFGIELESLQYWERIWFVPDVAMSNYLHVIQRNPQAVIAALEDARHKIAS